MPSDLEIVLDGSSGEGGGQILRTALSLATITGKPFTVHRIRANRIKPGLRPQHREATRAAARLCDAEVEGCEVGSSRLVFRPRTRASPGVHAFDIGTAGSAPLLFQTLCFPLALAGGRSELTLRGGTHQQYSPTFHYLALVWAPAMARLGFGFALEMQEAGFYPEGGGVITAAIDPAHAMPPLDLRHRGTLGEVQAVAMVGGLSSEVSDRMAARASRALRDIGVSAETTRLPVPARISAGAHLLVVASFERSRAGCGAVGDRTTAPERVADEAVKEMQSFLSGGAAVDRHLADQLLLPASLCAAGLLQPPPGVVPATRYTVAAVTKHLTTNAEVIRRFLDVEIAILGREGEEGQVRVQPPGASGEVVRLPQS
jgi:RNA 3'-terminal phosphate cyclase (ATP)